MHAPKFTTYLLSLLSMTLLDAMAYAGDERAELDLIIRQLQTAGQLAQRAEQASNSSARYRLDYLRLHRDLQHIQAGLHDYLSPRRAQPADPSELNGGYITEPPRESAP